LPEINSLRIFGTAKDKESIVSFGIKATHPHDVATIIDRSGIAVRAVTHCVILRDAVSCPALLSVPPAGRRSASTTRARRWMALRKP
jgi:selenocysteine lyase/cysteine desulfurase